MLVLGIPFLCRLPVCEPLLDSAFRAIESKALIDTGNRMWKVPTCEKFGVLKKGESKNYQERVIEIFPKVIKMDIKLQI